MPHYLGIDVGTSGVRGVVIDARRNAVAEHHVTMAPPAQNGNSIQQNGWIWWKAVCEMLEGLRAKTAMAQIAAIAIDGTSGTLLITDSDGQPHCDALMYNDGRATAEAHRIAAVAPQDCGAHGAGSALAKLLWLQEAGLPAEPRHAMHQADWVAGQLCGRFGVSDENNALKLGYDVLKREWPAWFDQLGVDRSLLPTIKIPGERVGTIRSDIAACYGLSPQAEIRSGTTDSVAAFLATGASASGDAVTSLGSTLALKVLSKRPVFAPEYGVYSHRLGDRWLIGGASNCGGTTLLQFFTSEQMAAMTPQLDPTQPTGLDYYPLPSQGERFPINDPEVRPRLTPRPSNDVAFFQGLLEGIAQVEARGYRLLAELGAPYPTGVLTMGGGAKNSAWRKIRARALEVTVTACSDVTTARGAALLAMGPPG